MSSNSSFSLPISEIEMLEATLEWLLSDDYSPFPEYLVDRKMLELKLVLSGENQPEMWKEVDFASRHSGNMLPEPEPEKEKASERKRIWSEEEKRLFRSGVDKYGWGKWKNISKHIGTRLPEQVRSLSRRDRKLKAIFGPKRALTHQAVSAMNSTNTLSSDSCGCLPGASAYGNNMKTFPAIYSKKMLESSSTLSGENKPDLWDDVAELMTWPQVKEALEMTWQQVEETTLPNFACRHSVNMLPEPEPEKEKALERKRVWSEEEKRLFLSGLEKYGPGKWKDISRHIGTRSSEQVRSYDRRRRGKLTTGDQQTHCQP